RPGVRGMGGQGESDEWATGQQPPGRSDGAVRGDTMRLGGPLCTEFADPEGWIAALRQHGYTAAYCPVGSDADHATVEAYAEAARVAGIVIAEVGAWSNPLSDDPEARRAALARCREQLALADRIGARCCVNIAGSRSERWDGPHPQNFSEETFEQIVETLPA